MRRRPFVLIALLALLGVTLSAEEFKRPASHSNLPENQELGQGIGHDVENQVRLHIDQHEVPADDPVSHFFGKLGHPA